MIVRQVLAWHKNEFFSFVVSRFKHFRVGSVKSFRRGGGLLVFQ